MDRSWRAECLLAQTFVREKPESSVPAVIDFRQVHRSAGGGSKFIANQLGGGVAILPGPRAQTVRVIAERLKSAAMQLVRAALGRERDGGWPRISRARTTGFNPELLHGIESRLHTIDAAAETVHDRDAVLQHLRRADLKPIHTRRAPAFHTRSQVE